MDSTGFRTRLLQELDLEAGFIREHLLRVPGDKLAWKPHERAMTLGWLATFLGMIWDWVILVFQGDSFDPAKAAEGKGRPAITGKMDQIIDLFDRKVAAARQVIAIAPDEAFEQPWTLLANGDPLFTQPRWLVLRTYVMNHAIHHRAQLGVFLRMLDRPVPAVYSDSADERGGMFMTRQG